jgi:hypothetical protein
MEPEITIERPVFAREPDHINGIGTKFWMVNDFDELLEEIPVDGLKIYFSEYIDDDGEEFWGYLVIEGDDVMFETLIKDDIETILEAVKQESIDRGLIEFELDE